MSYVIIHKVQLAILQQEFHLVLIKNEYPSAIESLRDDFYRFSTTRVGY